MTHVAVAKQWSQCGLGDVILQLDTNVSDSFISSIFVIALLDHVVHLLPSTRDN